MTGLRISRLLALATGLFLLLIGGRFLWHPEAGEAGFGLTFAEAGDYSFHYIKGVRDLFCGLLFTLLALTRQDRTLGTALLAGALIPSVDAWIVLSYAGLGWTAALPHVSAFLLCVGAGLGLLLGRHPRRDDQAVAEEEITTLMSVRRGDESTSLEMTIAAGAGTPDHYHERFAETITVLEGALLVRRNKQTRLLTAGETITIERKEQHGFTNESGIAVRIRVDLWPGDADFETAMLLYTDLQRAGRTLASGIPRNPINLAIFVNLNDTHLRGVASLGEWLLAGLNQLACLVGYRQRLLARYSLK